MPPGYRARRWARTTRQGGAARRLVALVPPPRANQVLCGGVLASRHRWHRAVRPRPPRSRAAPPGVGLRLTRKPQGRSRHIPWSTLLWRTFDVIGAACPTCGRVMALRAVVRGTETGRLLAGLERAARGPPLRAEQRAGTGSAAGVRDGDGGVLLPRRGAPRMRRSGGWHSVDGALGRMTPTRATERLRRQPVARTLNACHHPWLWRQSSTEASQLVAAPIKEGSSPCA